MKITSMRRAKMAEPVIVAAFLRSRAGKKEELAGRLQALVLAARSDPGVITYNLHTTQPQKIPPCGFYRSATNRKNISTDIRRRMLSFAVFWPTPQHSWMDGLTFGSSGWLPKSPGA
jgi:hypothetical protein